MQGHRRHTEPFSRAGGYYARSWRRYLSRRADTGVPVMRPTPGLAGQALLDEIVLAGFRLLRSPGGDEMMARIASEVTEAAAMYERAGWSEEPANYHTHLPVLTEVRTRTLASRPVTYERVLFDSEYEPHAGEPGRCRIPSAGQPGPGRS